MFGDNIVYWFIPLYGDGPSGNGVIWPKNNISNGWASETKNQSPLLKHWSIFVILNYVLYTYQINFYFLWSNHHDYPCFWREQSFFEGKQNDELSAIEHLVGYGWIDGIKFINIFMNNIIF